MGKDCRHCGFDNGPGAKFCGGCGRTLGQEGEVTHPRFVTGKKGRPYCAAHTLFDGRRMEEYDNEKLVRPLRAHSLACQSCEHYIKDDCYFSKGSIDAITENIFKRRVRCDFCIYWWVVSPVVVLQKIYFENEKGGKGYVFCPWCDHFLKTGKRPRERRRYMAILFIPMGVYALLTVLLVRVFGWSYFYLGWDLTDKISILTIVGLSLFLWYRWISQLKIWVKKRRNLKNYLFDLHGGKNTKIFLAVD